MRTSAIGAVAAAIALMPYFAHGAEPLETRLNSLATELDRQSEVIHEQQNTINQLKERLTIKAPEIATAPPAATNKPTGLFGGSLMSNPYLSLVLDGKGYISNLKNDVREGRGIPGYTVEGGELRNGFNVDAAELSIFAPVDPYFNLYVTIPVTDEGAELEEAYFVTTGLPEGFQIKGGRFKSNTSRMNSQHPHAWDFADISLPYRAFLGGEGLGGENGVQITWLPPLPVYTLVGIEALQGDSSLLFGENSSWGPHGFSAFAKVSVDTSDNSTLYAGPWVLFGKTNTEGVLLPDSSTGSLRGDSVLGGVEAVWKWKEGKQAVTLQGEYLYLTQDGDLTQDDGAGGETVSRLNRRQDGLLLQALYRHDRWRVGARYDQLDLFSSTFKRDGVQQDSGTPWRVTGSLEFNPTEFSTIRAQFAHDRSDPRGRVNNEGILQVQFTIGAHPAHAF